ncbi:hypothetical protein DXX93_03630 [Thalassotalea euphylliae]|uniref:Uncharacterized protein n=1 Tax=Thalassotalea euphylliae TaxID=1655234 RepID=A0A3E0TNS1_9GAMM|nr:hypothetical protein [Thalassotalea euphylliae]REL25732.1 hypothetical protein DXX93_03630 [Thalassotalea euphylliae]
MQSPSLISSSDSVANSILEQKIRQGTDPDNPVLIHLWLSCQQTENLSLDKLRAKHTAQFKLLLEAVLDELVPTHWRRTCLDNIYLPLSALKKLSNNEASEQHLRDLFNELAISTRYIESSLNHY